jgi:hypothetical protein
VSVTPALGGESRELREAPSPRRKAAWIEVDQRRESRETVMIVITTPTGQIGRQVLAGRVR